MNNPLTAIVILNYKAYQDTINCVESLLLHLKQSVKIIIVDNASPNESREKIASFLANLNREEEIVLVQNEKNLGFSGGNNTGIVYAKEHWSPDYYWILNNDTLIDSDALQPLIQWYKNLKNPGIIGSKLIFEESRDQIQALGGKFIPWKGRFIQIGFKEHAKKYVHDEITEVDFVIGASLFVSKAFIEKVGLLSEDYFLYYEEIDWATRASRLGFLTYNCNKSVIYHKQGSSTENKSYGKRNPKMMYYQFKNLILFYKKFYPLLLFVPISVVIFRGIKLALKEDPKFIRLILAVLFLKRRNYFEEQ